MPNCRDSRAPSYRCHKPSGQAAVTLNGRDVYLGVYRSRASRIEYNRLMAEWLANDRQPIFTADDRAGVTVAELILRYWKFAKQYYRRDGQPTGTVEQVRYALRPLRKLYGHTLVRDFGPLALKAVRGAMIDDGLSRRVVNFRIGKVKQMFKWGVAEELVPPLVYQGLAAVDGLRKGRSPAPEAKPIGPVADEVVQATLPHLTGVVADMVRFQRLTGCRPAEVCLVRPRNCTSLLSQDPASGRPSRP